MILLFLCMVYIYECVYMCFLYLCIVLCNRAAWKNNVTEWFTLYKMNIFDEKYRPSFQIFQSICATPNFKSWIRPRHSRTTPTHHPYKWAKGRLFKVYFLVTPIWSTSITLSHVHRCMTWTSSALQKQSEDNVIALRWHHNGHDGVSNHQPCDCLLSRLLNSRSKKTSKLRVTGLCAGNSPATGEFPAQMASNAENVSIWWRHHSGCCPQLAEAPTAGPHPLTSSLTTFPFCLLFDKAEMCNTHLWTKGLPQPCTPSTQRQVWSIWR